MLLVVCLRLRPPLLLGALSFLLAPGCLEPTQVTLEITTNAVCDDLNQVQIVVDKLSALSDAPVSAATDSCNADGRIGDVVLIPQKDKSQSVNFAVVVGVNQPTSACAPNGYVGGCIVARRALTFVPHRPLRLPVELELECVDVPCSATQTCRKGQCVSATLDDPENCTDPLGCDDQLPGSGGTSSGGTTSSGGSDTGGGVNSGGTNSGGASTGGAETGGAETGGAPTGGASAGGTGGAGTGGTGGVSTGGTGGAGGQQNSSVHHLDVSTSEDIADGDTSSIDALLADKGADNEISLREAIAACNNTINDGFLVDEIGFAIPGAGTHTIAVQAPGLPMISDSVLIDGFGALSTPQIELSGTAAGTAHGLVLTTGSFGSYIKGLVINGFSGAGILVENDGAHTILGNHIGTNVTGNAAIPNGYGIWIMNSASNLIGGSLLDATQVNTLSGNLESGVRIEGSGSVSNTVQGNVIGLAQGATVALGNKNGVVLINGATKNHVGGDSAHRNIVSANADYGILIQGVGSDENVLEGNFIGTDSAYSASSTLGNGKGGIEISQSASSNRIGSSDASFGNRIAHNQGAGVQIQQSASIGNSILGNLIENNLGLGIDLSADDVTTPNDPFDADAGANDLLNFPDILSTTYATGSVTVSYELDVPAGNYRVEFFVPFSADGSGYGEGGLLTYVQSISHPGGGAQPFNAVFPVSQTALLSATNTQDLGSGNFGSTSEFSLTVPTTYAEFTPY